MTTQEKIELHGLLTPGMGKTNIHRYLQFLNIRIRRHDIFRFSAFWKQENIS